MKKFTKLALAASVALSANAMAMQAMDDSALSSTTGQDGISIGIGISKVEIDKVFVHDNDGLAEGAQNIVTPKNPATGGAAVARTIIGGTGEAGAIVIQGVTDAARANTIFLTTVDNAQDDTKKISTADFGVYVGANYSNAGAYLLNTGNLADLQIDTDAGTKVDGGAFLNIAAQVSGLEIHIGEIGVTASNAYTAGAVRRGGKLTGADANYNAILSGLSIKTGQMAANIQVGAAPQGAMIQLDTTMIGGLEILNLGLLDNSTAERDAAGVLKAGGRKAGEIFIESIKIADKDESNLTIKQSVEVMGASAATNKGYIKITSDSGAHDIYVKGIHLGSYTRNLAPTEKQGTSIGDVEISGMQTYYTHPTTKAYMPGSVITIAGR